MTEKLNDTVQSFWEQGPCGTESSITDDAKQGSPEWFQRIEDHRYAIEPMIHAIAQFTRHHGKKILEVGVGAGTDHLQWARAGADCHGVDLTKAAIETTKQHLVTYGFQSKLSHIDAEKLPFPDETFDVVYSWGVIHHSERPEAIINEIRRVLKKDGLFIGMMYGRHSLAVFKVWLRYALFAWKPWRSFKDVIWHHVESLGTKAYTINELKSMFSQFQEFSAKPWLTVYDTRKFPRCLVQFFPDRWGWFISLRAKK